MVTPGGRSSWTTSSASCRSEVSPQLRAHPVPLCPLCAHPAPPHPPCTPPHPPQGRGLISSPLITAPRSRLRLSCWLIFNPSAQQGQTCWAGSSACSPPLPPCLHPSHPDLQPFLTGSPCQQNTAGCVPPLPIPWVIAGVKAPLCALSLPGERPRWGGQGWEGLKAKRAPARGSGSCVENSAGSADTGLAPALCQTALGRHVCLRGGAGAAGWVPPGFPWLCPIPWLCPPASPCLCPMQSPHLHPLGSPHLHPLGSPRAPFTTGLGGEGPP